MVLPAHASAREELQVWSYETVDAPLGNGHKATLELSPRFRESGEILQSRVLVDFRVADGVMLGGAVTHVALPGGDEWRTHQQLNVKTGQFAFRSRLEQRYFADGDRPQFRFRQRIQYTQPVAPRTQLVGRFEFLYILQDDERGVGPSVDNLRFAVAAEHNVADNLQLGAGYMMIVAPREGDDTISHVPMLTLTYHL